MDRMEKLMEFLKADPHDAFIKHALALEYIKTGNETQARMLLEEILIRDPGYTGSYYHLAKLLERIGEKELAVEWYEKGMEAAGKAGEKKTLNELRAAYDDLVD